MASLIQCAQCRSKLKVPENLLGKKIKCPVCGVAFTAEAEGAERATPTAPPPESGVPQGTAPTSSQIIECSQCQSRLEVPEHLFGKQVICPECGTAFTAEPKRSGAPAPPPLPRDDGIQAKSEPPKLPATRPSKPRYDDDDEGENDSLDDDFAPPRSIKRGRRTRQANVSGYVFPPAICMAIAGVLGVLINLFQVVIAIANPAFLAENNVFGQDSPPALNILFGLLFTLVSIGIIGGAACMMKTKAYGFAMAASIMSIVNIGNCCCILGLPFGIWSLIVLCWPEVKEAFDS